MGQGKKGALYLKGMHGMGDNFHQRALIRHYLQEYDTVWLETSWASLYWDLIPLGLKVLHKESNLRTQTKNAARERSAFSQEVPPLPQYRTDKQLWYRAHDIRTTGSVLGAMAVCLGIPQGAATDFRFPVKPEWQEQYYRDLEAQFHTNGKPILVYRPLVERREWTGGKARNPDHNSYGLLYKSIRDRFFVVSVADIEPGLEWITDNFGIKADIEFHKGELSVEMLATLVHNAAMTFCAPGFAVVMSQAVGTPVVCVFGGYENSLSFSVGAKWAPYLGIDPINSCQCFMHTHNCNKRINLALAMNKLQRFVYEHTTTATATRAQATSGLEVPA